MGWRCSHDCEKQLAHSDHGRLLLLSFPLRFREGNWRHCAGRPARAVVVGEKLAFRLRVFADLAAITSVTKSIVLEILCKTLRFAYSRCF